MRFVLILAVSFVLMNIAWLLTYSDNPVYVFAGFALMAGLAAFSLYLIVQSMGKSDPRR